jgi:hypothetical protein
VSPHFCIGVHHVQSAHHPNWKNQTYEVPDLDQLEAWVIDSVCETPEGDIVEPDHPDSWLSLLGII